MTQPTSAPELGAKRTPGRGAATPRDMAGLIPSAVSLVVVAVWLLAPGAALGAADARDAAPEPLTGPRSGDALEIGLDHLFGPTGAAARKARSDGDEFHVSSRRVGAGGITSIVLRQVRGGLPVWKGSVAVHVDAQGRVVAASDRSEIVGASLRSTRARVRPTLSCVDATRHAFDHLGLEPREEIVREAGPEGLEQACRLGGGGVAHDGIRAGLMWLPDRHRATPRAAPAPDVLVWNLWIEARRGAGAWEINLDAHTGALETMHDRLRHDQYRVYAEPLANPVEGERTLAVDPADLAASPFGWHDSDGAPPGDQTTTRGNNAIATDDSLDLDDSLGFAPDGGPGFDFDFAIPDLDLAPEASRAAAITNAFYWVNRLHDVFYRYGFDEASGNFQANQYGNPALDDGPDPVLVDVQDGWATENLALRNNASFFTPPDGQNPRMQLFIWTDFRPRVRVDAPELLRDSMPAGDALFGPGLNSTGVTGQVVIAIDPVEAPDGNEVDACSPLSNAAEIAGNVAYIHRGQCDFELKVSHAEAAGAVAAIIVNRESSDLVSMLGVELGVTIPSLLVGRHNGDRIRDAVADGVTVTLFQPVQELERDSAFSNGTITHEFGHGLSTRLTGGGNSSSCLDAAQPISMGEGWSDFVELVMTAKPGDTRETLRTNAPFLTGESPSGAGIRRFPYTTDRAANPLVYSDLAAAAADGPIREHDGGEIWASALWEVYWNLVDAHGFDPDLHDGYTGQGDGNALALQLVVDALAIQPCEPTFLDARDAVRTAEAALTGGANACHLWRGFAARGLGVSADDGGSPSAVDVIDGFDVPEACPEPALALLQAAALACVVALRRRPRRG